MSDTPDRDAGLFPTRFVLLVNTAHELFNRPPDEILVGKKGQPVRVYRFIDFPTAYDAKTALEKVGAETEFIVIHPEKEPS